MRFCRSKRIMADSLACFSTGWAGFTAWNLPVFAVRQTARQGGTNLLYV